MRPSIFHRASRSKKAFTIVEVMIALAIMTAIFAAIYACWSAVSRGAQVGLKAAAKAQREHMVHRLIEEAMMSAVMFQANQKHYEFIADTSSDYATVSFVSRISETFPGSGVFGRMNLRRITFTVREGTNGVPNLVMEQMPMLMVTNDLQEPYEIVLAEAVREFRLSFWDESPNGADWVDEWTTSNRLPKVIRYMYAQDISQGTESPTDSVVTSGIVSVPSVVIPAAYQGIAPNGGGRQGSPQRPAALTPSNRGTDFLRRPSTSGTKR